jgi:carboxyl-terminal processing protease
VNSAGEALAVYFKGRPDTRSFGTPTCGHHHLLQDFPLNDGAVLWLTTACHEDRTRQKYRGPIGPDEVITNPEQAVIRAVAWLQNGR